MCAEQIVTDIDNTILNSEPRLRRTLQQLGLEELLPELLARYDGVKALLKPEEQELFYRLFLSERYLHLDEPLPGAAAALHALKEAGYRIVYLTGRHDGPGDSMRSGTEAWLEEHGFPRPGDGSTLLWMKPRRGIDDRRFKEEALRALAKLGPLRAGIGDRPTDMEAYLSQGMLAFLIRGDDRCPGDGLRPEPGRVAVVRDWLELQALFLSPR